jgi:hypothetical protein
MRQARLEVTMTRIANALGKSFCVGCLAAITLGGTVDAQTTPPARGGMAMMADCQKMVGAMTAGQEKLDDLIAKMNAATGQLKVDQMAAVLTELVAQQKAMRAHMMCMGHHAAPPANTPKEQPPAAHEQHH